ncbi:SDR family oxidoreductase [Alteromonas confluentis]|uniref:NAD-dependent dehydratase n=1 Tax=Alteromonas confluentis TaxID=1656094 RepID=A0A1E7Z8P6_9ALTE|nr:SDR family oxidoreductase [Alteromonas confluentis]OFC69900.1 NAD-dependent dehydratase [Alteromonas confluentis]
MANVFVVGAAGNVGTRLVSKLVKGSHHVVAMHRKEQQQQDLEGRGARTCLLSITETDVPTLASAIKGCDTVVFTAGAGGASEELTNKVDGEGLEKTVDAAIAAGAKRFVLVSAFPDAGRGKKISDTFENYMRVKRLSDAYLAESELDWVILRPGTLTIEEGTGKVNAGYAIKYGDVSRDNVADTIRAIIDNKALTHKIIELTDGDVPVDEAIGKFV